MKEKKRCICFWIVIAVIAAAGICAGESGPYLYKKTDNTGAARGLISCSSPQPARDGLVKIDKAEFDAIQAQLAEADKAKPAKKALKKQIKDLEERIEALEMQITVLLDNQ